MSVLCPSVGEGQGNSVVLRPGLSAPLHSSWLSVPGKPLGERGGQGPGEGRASRGEQGSSGPTNIGARADESRSVVSDPLRPHGLYSPGKSPGRNTGVVAFPFSRGSSHPRDRTQVSHIAGGFFTAEPCQVRVLLNSPALAAFSAGGTKKTLQGTRVGNHSHSVRGHHPLTSAELSPSTEGQDLPSQQGAQSGGVTCPRPHSRQG